MDLAERHSFLKTLECAVGEAEAFLADFLPPLSTTPLGDLARIVAYEIESEIRLQDANDLTDTASREIGIAAARLLSKVAKAAEAIEQAYCGETGLESQIRRPQDLETALETRRYYQRFWTALDSVAQSEGLERRLRSSATLIARLRGRPIFLDLRPHDRRLLLRLQRRIQEWLTGSRGHGEGNRIWSDLRAFGDLLRMINHRSELIEHDMMKLPELRSVLASLDPGSRPLLDPALMKGFQPLRGRDPVLDGFLAAPSTATAEALADTLAGTDVALLASQYGTAAAS
ncbi:MAG: hypothetical protein AAGN66_10900 [Acidobacteriota bacterium]